MTIVRTALAASLLALSAFSQTIQFEGGTFKVAGWKPGTPPAGNDWSAVFSVYALAGGSQVEKGSSGISADAPPMLGEYAIEGESLVFHPRFPLTPGMRFRAVFTPAGRAPIESTFDGPKKDTTPTTRVEHVYPSVDILPINQLKLYIYFSAPMSRGEAWTRIHLLDAAGKVVPAPFVQIDQELWGGDGQRLTVLFDPGRIKRGLVPNAEMGPPLVDGKEFTLLIDRNYQDARGVPLQEEYRKKFRGGPADRTPPDPKTWKVTPPKAGTTEALVVDFGEPMDYAIAQRALTIPGITGKVVVDSDERRWQFRPDDPWKAGRRQLVIDATLEDLAGNQIGRAFDLETTEKVPRGLPQATVSLPFTIR